MPHSGFKQSAALKTTALAAMWISLSGVSFGHTPEDECRWNRQTHTRVCAQRAPEIDASSAAAGLPLLLGALAVLRGRRAKNLAS